MHEREELIHSATPLEYHDMTQIFKLLVTMTLIWKILTGGELEATGVTGAVLMEWNGWCYSISTSIVLGVSEHNRCVHHGVCARACVCQSG